LTADFLFSFRYSCGAVDGCLTPILTPSGEHKEDFTDRKSQCSLLLIPIVDTRRIRYIYGGFPGSRGDSLAFRGQSWYGAAEDRLLRRSILSIDEFILGDAGFVLTPFLVRARMFPTSYCSMCRARGSEERGLVLGEYSACGRASCHGQISDTPGSRLLFLICFPSFPRLFPV